MWRRAGPCSTSPVPWVVRPARPARELTQIPWCHGAFAAKALPAKGFAARRGKRRNVARHLWCALRPGGSRSVSLRKSQ